MADMRFAKQKYQDLKDALGLNGGGWGSNSRSCSQCNGGTRIAVGKKNILITACVDDTVAVQQALDMAGLTATYKAFVTKTEAEIARGAWEGGEFTIGREHAEAVGHSQMLNRPQTFNEIMGL